MSADVHIDRATALDVELCRRLILSTDPWMTLQYDESDVQAIVRAARNDHLLLARVDNQAVGFALSTPGILLGEYLKILVVDDAYRAHGIGRQLMEALEARAFRRWPNVYLCVSDFNQSARRFYQRLGYEEVGLLKDLLLPGKGEVLMRKSIAGWRRFKAGGTRPD